MNADWKQIQYNLHDVITKNKIDSFDLFCEVIGKMSNEKKGLYFECLCKLYFTVCTVNKTKYKHFYMYSEIPSILKTKLNLPAKDKGIDCIVMDHDNKIYAVQCKFRSHNNRAIPFGELATFPALTFGSSAKIHGGIFFSNCYDVCDELKNKKYTHILYNTLDKKCDHLFWKNVVECIDNKPISMYATKKPLQHQQQIILHVKRHYETENKGRLYLACGSGKTFLGYWLGVREFGYDKIFIVVPSLYLLSQTYETWIKETQYDTRKYHFLLIGSDMDSGENMSCEYRPTTDPNTIGNELKKNNRIVVVVTYHSSNLLVNICKKLKYTFDFGIYDEAHRTVGDDEKCFTYLITSNIEKRKLFMTATEKIYSYKNKISDDKHENILSMDNENIYGKIIYRYSMRQAIDDNVLVDYRIIAPCINSKKYTEEILNNRFVNDNDNTYDIKTILTGIMIISSFEKCNFKHLLIFSNLNERAKSIIEFIENYISKTGHKLNGKINCKFLSGKNNMNIRKREVKEFENCDMGIISSAKIFGEGVDIKICDAVCFADGKNSSVDIVQYVGRCLRRCEKIPNKLSYVLVPFILDDEGEFFDCKNQSYSKLRKILKTIGTTDEFVT